MTDYTKKSLKWLKVFDLFRHISREYKTTFGSSEDGPVLMDLAKFCYANENTIGLTVEQTYVAIGRREVWLRIQQRANLSPETLTNIYVGNQKDDLE